MNKRFVIAGLATVLLIGGSIRAAEESAPATQPAEKPVEKTDKPEKMEKHKSAKLTKPWSELTNLTDDQKTQIEKIHGDTIAERDKLDAKEKTDIIALLTDDQKTQLQTMKEKEATERAAKNKEAREKMKKDKEAPAVAPTAVPTTEPAK